MKTKQTPTGTDSPVLMLTHTLTHTNTEAGKCYPLQNVLRSNHKLSKTMADAELLYVSYINVCDMRVFFSIIVLL